MTTAKTITWKSDQETRRCLVGSSFTAPSRRVDPAAQVQSRRQQQQEQQASQSDQGGGENGVQNDQAEDGTLDCSLHVLRRGAGDGLTDRNADQETKADQQIQKERRRGVRWELHRQGQSQKQA